MIRPSSSITTASVRAPFGCTATVALAPPRSAERHAATNVVVGHGGCVHTSEEMLVLPPEAASERTALGRPASAAAVGYAQRPSNGVPARMPPSNAASHALLTAATFAAGMYTTKAPPTVAQNRAVPAGQPDAATSCAPLPPPNAISPNPRAGMPPPRISPGAAGAGPAGVGCSARRRCCWRATARRSRRSRRSSLRRRGLSRSTVFLDT